MPTPINAAGTAATPIDGFGTIFEYSTDSGSTWHQVANLVDVKPHKWTAGKIKTTTHSTTGGDNTYRGGLGEPGETEFELLYDYTAFNTLCGIKKVQALFRTTYRDSATDKLNGYVAEVAVKTPMEGDASIEVKVQHSGVTTVAAS